MPSRAAQLDGLAVGAGDPHRRMRLLHRLRHDVAARHREILALEAGIGVHHHHVEALLDRFVPRRALLGDRHAIAAEFEERRGFAGAEFDAAVGDEIERGDALGDAGRMIVARAASARCRGRAGCCLVRCEQAARNTSGAEEWEYSSRKWCSTSQA